MTVLRRLVCLFRGHVTTAWMLPEDHHGLYAYSRLFCSRCDLTFDTNDCDECRSRCAVCGEPCAACAADAADAATLAAALTRIADREAQP